MDAPGHFVNVRTSCMEPFQAHERDLDLAGLAEFHHKAAWLAEMHFYKDCVYRKHTMQIKEYTSWI